MRSMMILVLIALVGCTGDTNSTLNYDDIPRTGDVTNGERLYVESIDNAPVCTACHNPAAVAAPTLIDYGAIAGARVEGQDAHEYTFYAIAEPAQHIVEGYGNAMYAGYDERMTPQQMSDLIAYLLSL